MRLTSCIGGLIHYRLSGKTFASPAERGRGREEHAADADLLPTTILPPSSHVQIQCKDG